MRSRRNNIKRYNDGKPSEMLNSIADNSLSFLGSAINGFSSPTLQYVPRTVQQNGPVSYERTNAVDSNAEMSNLKSSNLSNTVSMAATGAQLGNSIVPVIGGAIGGVAGAIGGLFGGAARKRKMRRLIDNKNREINASNNFNQASALTTDQQMNYYSNYDNTENDNLFNTGKTPFTKSGNSLVGKGETIVDGNTGNTTEVTSGSGVGNDDVQANIAPEDAVLGNLLNPSTGNTFAEDAKPLTRMEKKLNRNIDRNSSIIAKNTYNMVHRFTNPIKQKLVEQQAAVHSNTINKYDYGKNPYDFTTGFDINGLPNVINPGVDTTMGGMKNISFDPVNRPETFGSRLKKTISNISNSGVIPNVTNTLLDVSPILYNLYKGNKQQDTITAEELNSNSPYDNAAIKAMLSRKYNASNELNELNGYARRSAYNSRQLGSEAGINRYMDLANTTSMLDMMDKIYSQKQNVENQYLGDYANTLDSIGNQYASRMSAAKNASYDWNQKSKAARSNYTGTGLSQLSEWNQGRRKSRLENEWMNKYFNLYHK